MSDNVIEFPKLFEPKPSFDPIPVNKILLAADKHDLDEVIVLGQKDGRVEIFSSESDITKIIYLCEYAKALITKSVIGDISIVLSEPKKE